MVCNIQGRDVLTILESGNLIRIRDEWGLQLCGLLTLCEELCDYPVVDLNIFQRRMRVVRGIHSQCVNTLSFPLVSWSLQNISSFMCLAIDSCWFLSAILEVILVFLRDFNDEGKVFIVLKILRVGYPVVQYIAFMLCM